MGEDRSDEISDAKAKLNALFGGGGSEAKDTSGSAPLSKEDEARAKLEALFKK